MLSGPMVGKLGSRQSSLEILESQKVDNLQFDVIWTTIGLYADLTNITQHNNVTFKEHSEAKIGLLG